MLQASTSRYDRFKKEVEDFSIDPIAASQQLQQKEAGESAKSGGGGVHQQPRLQACMTAGV